MKLRERINDCDSATTVVPAAATGGSATAGTGSTGSADTFTQVINGVSRAAHTPTVDKQDKQRAKYVQHYERLEAQKALLLDCVSVIQVNNRLKPYELLGVAASSGLTSSLVGLTVSFFSAVFSSYRRQA